MNITGRIHSFESFGTLDGPGIRFVVFLQGCPLRCKYCHNPDSWNAEGGRIMTVSEIVEKIESCRSYIHSGGVTISGGEPLMQADFTRALLEACRKSGFHTALDTAGSLPLDRTAATIESADLVLLDIKALSPELCRRLTGSGNKNELATLNYCEKRGKPVWIRHVLVPGWTLDRGKLKKLALFLRSYHCVEKVELLPFHRMAEFKWKALGFPNPFENVREPSADEYKKAVQLFELTMKGDHPL